ncbi:hypothetical protein L1887_36586 [Cichorium endivia]|nr:hypothetical protein L1887_36586 [Cichorium endivia]
MDYTWVRVVHMERLCHTVINRRLYLGDWPHKLMSDMEADVKLQQNKLEWLWRFSNKESNGSVAKSNITKEKGMKHQSLQILNCIPRWYPILSRIRLDPSPVPHFQ